MAAGNERITPLSFTWRFLRVLSRPGAMKTMRMIRNLRRETRGSACEYLKKNAQEIPDSVAILFEDQAITWSELNERANQYAHFFKSRGIGAGDKIAVNLQNRPDILIATMGGLKLGAVMAMINTTQTSQVLAHSLKISEPKLLLVGAESVANMETLGDDLSGTYANKLLFVPESDETSPAGYENINELISTYPTDNLAETGGLRLKMPAYYIFTSGTTGMPKASVTTHFKLRRAGEYMCGMVLDLSPKDVLYCPLPFYHSNALVLSWTGVLSRGATIAIGRKFSATKFWDECRQHGATAFCYIGELLRYLLNQPAQSNDRDHKVYKILGNGLRPDIWDEFKSRFGVERVHEFYGSSEGNIAFINLLNYDKTCGWAPGAGTDWRVIGYDVETDAPLKTDGKYVGLKPGETGLLVMRVSERHPFDGYTDKSATQSKLLSDVFSEGDRWFNTGDLITLLPFGHIQFADRVGDTFRWQGENVATTEVEAAVMSWPGAEEAVVYGVLVPNTDGRCGMLSLTLKDEASAAKLEGLAAHLRKELPPYAIPRFVRLRGPAELTGTFKHKKSSLKEDGFSLEKVDDPLYVLAPSMPDWQELTEDLVEQIEQGQLRL